MIKKFVLYGAFFLSAALIALMVWFSRPSPSCRAPPPAQAAAAGYHSPVICNPLVSPSVADLNNTMAPGYLLYVSSGGGIAPASDFSFSSGALEILTTPNDDYAGLSSVVIINSSTPGGTYGSTSLQGGFYIQVDMKLDPAKCLASPNSWPVFWMLSPEFSATAPAPGYHYTEADISEYLNCSFVQTVHDWTGTTRNCQNTDNSPGFVPDSDWHSYGLLFIPSLATGTGSFQWWIDGKAQKTVTYSPTGFPDPQGTCPAGAFSAADTQPWMFVLQAGTNDPVYYRNLYVWRAP